MAILKEGFQGDDQYLSSNKLRTGISTGTCAAAAAKAATMLLTGNKLPAGVEIKLPSGEFIIVPIVRSGLENGRAMALVRKDGGDDPDVTHGLMIGARVGFSAEGIQIAGGKGVGKVTKPGLAVKPGRPAINPVPMEMIRSSVSGITSKGLLVEIFVPEGEKTAVRTFNERLGIKGGISILGTSGIVRPFSVNAIRETIALSINMFLQTRRVNPVLVPGRIGFRAARKLGFYEDQIIEVSNEWECALKKCLDCKVAALVLVGHPGKLLKFVAGDFQTHSKKSAPAVSVFESSAKDCLNKNMKGLNTVEQGIQSLDSPEKTLLGAHLALKVKNAVLVKTEYCIDPEVILIDLKGDVFGRA